MKRVMFLDYILEMNNISKSFPGVLALDDVTLKLKKGEVLALLGENGAGKSTLIKILSGANYKDTGTVIIDGKEVKYKSPTDAIHAGVGVIYQELNYLNDLSIAENIFIGNLPVYITGQVNWKKLKKDTKELLDIVGLHYDPAYKVVNLSVAEKQLMEIARAISKNIKIAVMDEPTSALSDTEIEKLFSLIHTLKDKGISVIYISHRIDEVFQISDRIQVMRDGKSVWVEYTEKATREQIVAYMVGREISSVYPKIDIPMGETLLKVDGLTTANVTDISFEVRKGEILCLYGLMGSGQTHIINAIFGIEPLKKGSIEVDGKPVNFKKPSDAIKSGLAYVPDERKKAGLILRQSVRRNMTITCLKALDRIYRIDTKEEKKLTKKWIERLEIKTPSYDTEVDSLSGGNQQKVVLAKWMAASPRILLLNEPTRGIDVGAKTEIYKLMEQFCQEGLGIVMISSELPEILSMADRVVVISEGKFAGLFERNELSQIALMDAAVGGK
jgi:ABC-type sugar transport system ATPase subunit